MRAKERRDRLFRRRKPNVRPLEAYDEQGNPGRDLAILWAAYRMGSFDIEEELSQEDFTERLLAMLESYHGGWIVEDVHNGFVDGEGPIGVILAVYNGWEMEPQFDWFQWASVRNLLRGMVGFLQMMRYNRDVGVVNVNTLKRHKRLFDRVAQYGVLNYVGKIPHGDARGDRLIYYVRGRKEPIWQ